jgi:hypothetical protein
MGDEPASRYTDPSAVDQDGDGELTFYEIWRSNPAPFDRAKLALNERLQTFAAFNSLAATALDAHATFGGAAEQAWTADANATVKALGAVLTGTSGILSLLDAPRANLWAAREKLAQLVNYAMDGYKPKFDVVLDRPATPNPNRPVAVSSAQAAEQDRDLKDKHYRTCDYINAQIELIVMQARQQDYRSLAQLVQVGLSTITTLKKELDPQETSAPSTPASGPAAGTAASTSTPFTGLAGAGFSAGAGTTPVSQLGGQPGLAGAAPILAPPSPAAGAGPSAGSGLYGLGAPAGPYPSARDKERRESRQWAVTEQDEIWGGGGPHGGVDDGRLA